MGIQPALHPISTILALYSASFYFFINDFFLCLIHALCGGRGTQKLFFIEKSFVRSLESDFYR